MNNKKYYNKYLKYKNKYILNKLKGGSDNILLYLNDEEITLFNNAKRLSGNHMKEYLLFFYERIRLNFIFIEPYLDNYVFWYNNPDFSTLFNTEEDIHTMQQPYYNYLPIIFIPQETEDNYTLNYPNDFIKHYDTEDQIIDYSIEFKYNNNNFTYFISKPTMIWWNNLNNYSELIEYKCWFKILDDDFDNPFLYFIILNYVSDLITKLGERKEEINNYTKVNSIKLFQNFPPYNIIVYFSEQRDYLNSIFDIINIIFKLFERVTEIYIGRNIVNSDVLYTFKRHKIDYLHFRDNIIL